MLSEDQQSQQIYKEAGVTVDQDYRLCIQKQNKTWSMTGPVAMSSGLRVGGTQETDMSQHGTPRIMFMGCKPIAAIFQFLKMSQKSSF